MTGHRYELVRGELREMPPAGHVHGEIALSIGAELRQFVKENRLGKTYAAETGFKVATSPDHVLAADAAFIRRERAENVGESTGFWPGAPDLAVEVISPRDTYSDVAEKALDWLGAGDPNGAGCRPTLPDGYGVPLVVQHRRAVGRRRHRRCGRGAGLEAARSRIFST